MPTLANAELAIMDLLWKDEPLAARQIREQLYPDSERPQQGTVQKLLQRLEEKGFVARDRDLSVHFYSARVSREEYASSQLEALADKVGGESFAPGLARLVLQGKLSHTDIDSLRSTIHDQLARVESRGVSGGIERGETAGLRGRFKEFEQAAATVAAAADGLLGAEGAVQRTQREVESDFRYVAEDLAPERKRMEAAVEAGEMTRTEFLSQYQRLEYDAVEDRIKARYKAGELSRASMEVRLDTARRLVFGR